MSPMNAGPLSTGPLSTGPLTGPLTEMSAGESAATARPRGATVAAVSTRHFTVAVRDLEDGPKSLSFPLGDGFLRAVYEGTDVSWTEPGTAEVELTKSGRQVLVRGRLRLDVTMPCARTLVPVPIALRPEIFLMLSETSGEGAVRRHRPRKKQRPGKAGAPNTSEKPGKKAYRPWVDDPELSDRESATDTYDGEEVVLDEFFREFLLLDLPMFPVASDLPTDANAAIPRPPAEKGETPVDPRLAPLAAIAARLRKDE